MIYSIEKGLKEVQDFLHQIGIADEGIRILNQGSPKLTWSFTGREKECNKMMFAVSPKSQRMYFLFFKIKSGECRASLIIYNKADEFVPTRQTPKDESLSIEQLKECITKCEKNARQSIKFLESEYGMTYHRECCDLFLAKNPDFLQMMNAIFGLDFEKYVESFNPKK